jgi:hypothetical protein
VSEAPIDDRGNRGHKLRGFYLSATDREEEEARTEDNCVVLRLPFRLNFPQGLRRLASGVLLLPIVEKASDHVCYATFAAIGAAGFDSGAHETLGVR